MAQLKTRSKGLLITITGVIILSHDALFIRLIEATSWTILFWRGLAVAASLTVFISLTSRHPIRRFRSVGRPGIVFAALSAAGNTFFVISIINTGVANTLVIVAVIPLLTAILSHLVLAEPIDQRTWIAAVAVAIGIATIFSGSIQRGHLLGDLSALAAAFSVAGWMTLVRRHRTMTMTPALALGGVLAAAVASPFAAPFAPAAADFALLAVTGLVALPLSLALIALGPRYLPPPEVSLLMLGEVGLSPLWVWLAVGERPTIEVVVAGFVVIGALVAHSMAGARWLRATSS